MLVSSMVLPTIACRTSQWHLLADMVLQRMGIALLPQYYTDMLDHNFICSSATRKTKYSVALSDGLEKESSCLTSSTSLA